MKVLVTGATGFLGGWMVRKLLDEGVSVRILQRRSSHLEDLEGLSLEHAEGDVTNAKSLVEASSGVNAVFHLAGLIGYSRAQREAMQKVNVDGTQNVIDACIKNKVDRLVHLSSVVAVGASFDRTPLNENSPYNVRHLNLGYFETKHDAELLVKKAVAEGKLDAVILNPSTIYGAGDAKKGSRGAQLKVAKGKMPFYTSGGVNVIAVEDVVDATISAWRNGQTGERYILSGENILIKDLFAMIAKEAEVAPPSIYLPNPVVHAIGAIGDALEKIGKKGPINSETAWTSTLYHWFDSSKAQRELGLRPKPASYAIAKSIGWVKEQGLLIRD
jgi:dihydroflavonol-4-reductase